MLDFDFLTDKQVIGENNLEIFKNRIDPMTAFTTDFSRLLGSGDYGEEYKYDGSLYYYYAYWYTKTIRQYHDDYDDVCVIDSYGIKDYFKTLERRIAARPVIEYSKIKDLVKTKKVNEGGILEIEFGEYPQFVVDDIDLKLDLQSLYDSEKLKPTGKFYTTDSVDFDDYDTKFKPYSHIEYEYNGEKYIRFVVGYNGEGVHLSTDEDFGLGETCWLRVEPIKWLVDEKSGKVVCKNAIFSGIQYCNPNVTDITDFKNTDIKKFMDTYFSKQILTEYEYDKLYNKEKKEEDNLYNPYNFDFSNVSEEEIIKGCVEANIAVMLHGKSGDGKSARVKELDPDAQVLYLINESPDSLCGKSIVDNGKTIDIPPTWYTKLVEKCEKEPDKIHIVFFDEITNAPASIQGMVFNIVLNKEVNGKWELPENARIVAAGNELEESMSSYGMSEPLFNRFAHVYIETKVEDFLMWASTPSETYERLDYKKENVPMKIHPSVYAYIAYKGKTVLRTEYNGKTPNADPRKWEMASKVLYETNKPEMIRSLVGEEVTQDFINFCQQRVITIEDVLSGNYTEADLEMNTGEKYNTAVGLSSVGVEHFEIVREFVKRLGPEICATFETLWAHGMEERLEKIQEIKLCERTK